jgi:methyl-accepting chemotaxis protein
LSKRSTLRSREQSAGAEQINQAIQQLDQVIQQNTSATEEMAATIEEISNQSEQLQEKVAFFRTRKENVSDRGAVAKNVSASTTRRTGPAGRGSRANIDRKGQMPKHVALDLSEKGSEELDEPFERL